MREITTLEELKQLKSGTVIWDAVKQVGIKSKEDWKVTGYGMFWGPGIFELPVVVLYDPDVPDVEMHTEYAAKDMISGHISPHLRSEPFSPGEINVMACMALKPFTRKITDWVPMEVPTDG